VPGLLPEETEASYDLAAALGTDALEEDLHLAKDCLLVARHNPWLSHNTNVADVAKTNAAQEYLKFFRLGVDGVFTDFTHTGVAARATYLRELGW
jgi:glycerophosphoryl diester phosphodiesterase